MTLNDLTPNLTPETRPLTNDELDEVFAILQNQDAILGKGIVDRLYATIQADRRRLVALMAVVKVRAEQLLAALAGAGGTT